MKRIVLVLALVAAAAACKAEEPIPPDVGNGTYTVEQKSVTLSEELHEEPAAPGSAAKATTRLLNARGFGDLNGDGKQDAAVVLTQSRGGSGTFYYAAAYLGNGKGGGTATPAVLLGDRIAIEAVGVASARITVRLLERNQGEPFTTAPSVRVTRIFEVKAGALSEVR